MSRRGGRGSVLDGGTVPKAISQLGYTNLELCGEDMARGTDARTGAAVVIKYSGVRSPDELVAERENLRLAREAAEGVCLIPEEQHWHRDAGFAALVLDDLQGSSLNEWIHDPESNALVGAEAIGSLANLLERLGAHGMVHGRIEPDTVVMTGDGVGVLDFAHATRVGEASAEVDGRCTPGFVHPERLGEGVSASADHDLFSVAALAYLLIAGAPPLGCSSFAALRGALEAGCSIPPLSVLVPGVPRPFEQAVMSALTGASDATRFCVAITESTRSSADELERIKTANTCADVAASAGTGETGQFEWKGAKVPAVKAAARSPMPAAAPAAAAVLPRSLEFGSVSIPVPALIAAVLVGVLAIAGLSGGGNDAESDGAPTTEEVAPPAPVPPPPQPATELPPRPDSIAYDAAHAPAMDGMGPERSRYDTTGGRTELRELVWRVNLEDPVKSSLVVASGRLFFGANDGFLYALDAATGSRAWRYDSGSDISGGLLLTDGRVYAGNDEGQFFAVDSATGQEIWTSELGSATWSSPLLVGDRVVVGTNESGVQALSTVDGSLAWTLEMPGEVRAPLSMSGGRIYAAAVGGASLCSNSCRYARDGDCDDGGRGSRYDMCRFGTDCSDCGPRRGRGSRTVHEVFDATSNVVSIDAATGQLLWTVEIPAGISSAVLPVSDSLLVADWGGGLRRLSAVDGSTEVSSSVEGLVTVGSTALSGSHWYIAGSEGPVLAVNPETLLTEWTYPAGGNASVLAGPDALFVPGGTDTLFALSTSTGQELWRFRTQAPITAPPAVWDQLTLFANGEGAVYAVR